MKNAKKIINGLISCFLILFFWLWINNFLPSIGSAGQKIPEVKLSVQPLDLSSPPTTEEIMAAGQLGGQLYPTEDIELDNNGVRQDSRLQAINLSFGEAMQGWNSHEYEKAIELFKEHIKEYPDSPWASEAVLHLGCDATYNGRYTEADRSFKWILEENKGKDHEGAKILVNKAKTRLGILKVYQNNFKEAKKLFGELKEEGSDWRDRTYASHWIQRLSRYTSNKLAMLKCGTEALAYLLEKNGKKEEARKVVESLPETVRGHSIKNLSDIASRYGYNFAAIRISPSELKNLPLPALMHISGKNEDDSGHYWILDKVDGDKLELFDTQANSRFKQSLDEFSREWSGTALVFSDKKTLPGTRLDEDDMGQLFGGCCGVQRPPDNQGNPSRNGGPSNSGNKCPNGSPVWSVNMVSMNLFVTDIPLWYASPRGPSVEINISYNSQSSINNYEPFGDKWQFNYASYLVVNTAGQVTISMPDGRQDVYSPNGTGGYNRPYQVFNTLTKIAENHFELKLPDDTVYVYNIPIGTNSLQPFLVEIRDKHDQQLTFGYVDYDTNVRLEKITDALNRDTNLTYNAQGLIEKVTDPFGRFATFEYDNRNLIKITDMGGYWASLTYDEDKYLKSIKTERGKWEFYIEPADGIDNGSNPYPAPEGSMFQNYRITVTNPLGGKEEYHYNGYSSYAWYVSPKDYMDYVDYSNNNFRSNVPKIRYDYIRKQMGEISKITYPEGGYVEYGYDTTGNRTSIKDVNGNSVLLTYDARGNITKITDPLGNNVQNTYDSDDNLTSLIDPKGNPTSFKYEDPNNDNLPTKIIDPENGETHPTKFDYNSSGELTKLTDAKGNFICFDYDSSGNIGAMKSCCGTNNYTDSYTHDPVGRVATHTDPKGITKSFSYDDIDRLTKVTYPGGSTKSLTYDCCGLGTVTDSSGTSTFLYDNTNRLESFTDIYGKTIQYSYDAAGNLISLTYPNGKVVQYEYDDADRLIEVKDWLNNATTYEYDNASRLINVNYPDGTTTHYEYDNANRLTLILDYKQDGSIIALYRYDNLDPSGNRKGISSYQPLNVNSSPQDTSYSYDCDNRLLTAGDTTFEYDNNGNMTKKTVGSNVTTFTWNYDNMLTQLVGGGKTYNYKYDALGSRVARTVDGVEKRYIGGIAETNASGSITAYYVYGLGLISRITPAGQAYYYHYDGLGSTVAITDSSGNIVNKYAYDAFGRVISQTETIANSFKYVGRFGVMDEGNGLLYMRARYYDPVAGRFINKDPIGLAGGINMYAYVGNNPVNKIDPLGEVQVQYDFWNPSTNNFTLEVFHQWIIPYVLHKGLHLVHGWHYGIGIGRNALIHLYKNRIFISGWGGASYASVGAIAGAAAGGAILGRLIGNRVCIGGRTIDEHIFQWRLRHLPW